MSDTGQTGDSPLLAAIEQIRRLLQSLLAKKNGNRDEGAAVSLPRATNSAAIAYPPFDLLREAFQLSNFELSVLLLCMAAEVDGEVAELCAQASGGPSGEVTFSLALALLPDGQWSALSPAGPLRYWQLLTLDRKSSLTMSPLRIEERILHFMLGEQPLEERLTGVVERVSARHALTPSQDLVVQALVDAVSEMPEDAPVYQLCGSDAAAACDVATNAMAAAGFGVWSLRTQSLPTNAEELDLLLRLWHRETMLVPCALLVDWNTVDAADERRLDNALRRVGGPLVVITPERRAVARRRVRTFEVARPTRQEQQLLWQTELGRQDHNGALGRIVFQFDMTAKEIASVAAEMPAQTDDESVRVLEHRLWQGCRVQSRTQLDGLMQRIDSRAGWADLVLPPRQTESLHTLAAQVRERATVFGTWKFGAASDRGLGISALFAGLSGTGKTLAAEVLAGELELDLYRIDLSAVVNKYIGETEKNLRRTFDVAEAAGAILLFDEADALFGKRSEVSDSHDRHANLEVSYLLQRMESYRGLSILTTNLKENLDAAFLRRLRFIVTFPFPDAPMRAAMWAQVFPPTVPQQGLDWDRLAKLTIAGGELRNIALGAAFLAADERGPVTMERLLRATRNEYAKLERTLTDAETRALS